MNERNKNTYILVVDDNPKNIQLIGEVLHEEHFQVGIADSGEQALNSIKTIPPDLVLLDIMMPSMDGFEVCRQLKKDPTTKDIPIIFLTALDNITDKVEGFKAGGVDYITKPIYPEELLSRVTSHLQLSRLQSELKHINHEAEKRIAERTEVLFRLNERLKEEIFERREAQAQLKQQNEQLIKETEFVTVLQAIAVAANEAQSIEEIMRISLERVCFLTQWPIGHVYLANEDRSKMISTKLWYLQEYQGYKKFREVTEILDFAKGEGLPGKVLATGKPIWFFDINDKNDSPRLEAINELKIKSAFAFPVLTGNQVEAVLEFFSLEVAEPDDGLLEVMKGIGNLIGRVVERKYAELARAEKIRMEGELKTAAAIQNHLLPRKLPEVPQVDLGSFYESASETGGDWYGFMTADPNHLSIFIGDVTGHGTPAALVTATACTTFRLLEYMYSQNSQMLETFHTPAELMKFLNQMVLEAGNSLYLMTFLITRLNLDELTITYSNAGHHFPLLIRGNANRNLLNVNYRLGSYENQEFKESTFQLKSGDLLCLYTDGLTETMDGDGKQWGERQLVRYLKKHRALPAQCIVDGIIEEINCWRKTQTLEDDVTLVILKIK